MKEKLTGWNQLDSTSVVSSSHNTSRCKAQRDRFMAMLFVVLCLGTASSFAEVATTTFTTLQGTTLVSAFEENGVILGTVTVHIPHGAGALPLQFKGVVKKAESKANEFILTVEAEKNVITYSLLKVIGGLDSFDVLESRYKVGSTHEFTTTLSGLRIEKSFSDQIRDLGHFPARVLKIHSSEAKMISIKRFDGLVVTHRQKTGIDVDPDFAALDEYLQDETTYDFPAALEAALAGRKPEKKQPDPSAKSTAVLSRYLGRWVGRIEGRPNERIEILYQWSASGDGLWRNMSWITLDAASTQNSQCQLIYDAKTNTYREVEFNNNRQVVTLSHRWNDEKRCFVSESSEKFEGNTRVTTAVFTTQDRIDWKTVQRDSQGKEVTISVGYYDRVK